MNLMYLKSRDMHLNLDRIVRVCHDIVLPVITSGEGITVVKKVVTVMYLMGDSDTRLHVYDADDRALLRERLGEVDRSEQETTPENAHLYGLAEAPEKEHPADDWRGHGTVGYDARMAETTGPRNVSFGPDPYIGNRDLGEETDWNKENRNLGIGLDAINDITTGTPPQQLHQFSTIKCPWCSKDYDAMVASCGTGTTWSLFKCQHCDKHCASGRHIPAAVQIDPEILIITP